MGLDWLTDGRLLVCNAELGMQVVAVDSGAVDALPCDTDFGVCNNAHVLADGTVLVSDSSSQYPIDEYQKDIIENTTSGRLIKVSAAGRATVLLESLSFANGVVCIDNGNTVLVAETGTGRINKVNIDGTQRGLFAETPGYPDNMSIGSDGNIWVAIPSMPNRTLTTLHKLPVAIRKFSTRLPDALQPKPELCCRVVVYDSFGNHLQTCDGDSRAFSMVTGVRENNGVVALGSIDHHCIGIFETG